MKRSYHGYLYVIVYLMILRIVLNITAHISIFNFGIIFDLVLMMFWIGAIAFLLKRIVIQKVFYIFSAVISTIFVIGDSIYYDYFGIISAKTSFAGIRFLSEGQTLEYDISIPLVGYIVLPILILVIYLIISNKKKDVFVFRDFAILSTIFIVQVGLFLFWGSYEYDTKVEYYRSDAFLFETMHDRALFSEKYGYYNYHILDFTRLRPQPDVAELKQEIDEYFALKENHQVNDMSDVYEGYNLITILAESLDVRFIDETLTPNLYMMKEDGYVFDDFYTTVYQQGATCNSEFMSLTGLNATSSNDWSNNVCDAYSENYFPYALPNQLADIGYNTYYFHSGYKWFYNRETIIPNYGFETVKFQEDIIAAGYDDFNEHFDTNMLDFFDEYVTYDAPFYINLLTYSGHGAYNQTDFDIYLDRVNAAYPNNEFDYQIINYMEKMVELDEMIGDVLTKLEEENQLDNTLLVIYPDHFPYMISSDIYLEYIDTEPNDPHIMHQELIMYTPNMSHNVVSIPGSTVDITPTLLNMLNSSGNFEYFMGVDLFSGLENYIIFSDLTISNGETFLTIDSEYTGPEVSDILFEIALEKQITSLEIQKKILNADYFSNFE